MSIKARIVNENGKSLNIDKEGNLNTIIHKRPPFNQDTTLLPLREYFKDDKGSKDMNVDGSVSPVEFFLKSDTEKQISIKSMFISIVDAGATLSEFGNISALTNGVEFIWQSQDFGEVVIASELKSNYDFVAFSGGQPAFGTGANAFKAQNVIGVEEAFLAFVDFQKLFGFEYGIPLRKGTNDRILFKVNDDISGVFGFTAIAYGNQF